MGGEVEKIIEQWSSEAPGQTSDFIEQLRQSPETIKAQRDEIGMAVMWLLQQPQICDHMSSRVTSIVGGQGGDGGHGAVGEDYEEKEPLVLDTPGGRLTVSAHESFTAVSGGDTSSSYSISVKDAAGLVQDISVKKGRAAMGEGGYEVFYSRTPKEGTQKFIQLGNAFAVFDPDYIRIQEQGRGNYWVGKISDLPANDKLPQLDVHPIQAMRSMISNIALGLQV